MKRKREGGGYWLAALLSLLLFAAAAAWVARTVEKASEVSEREGLRQAELAIRQAAASCYALDGAYPASYADLKDRSAIAVDEERYKVFYEVFASNIMPEITVVRRKP